MATKYSKHNVEKTKVLISIYRPLAKVAYFELLLDNVQIRTSTGAKNLGVYFYRLLLIQSYLSITVAQKSYPLFNCHSRILFWYTIRRLYTSLVLSHKTSSGILVAVFILRFQRGSPISFEMLSVVPRLASLVN